MALKETKKIIRLLFLAAIIIGAAVFFKEPQRRQKLFSLIAPLNIARADMPAPSYAYFDGCGCSAGSCCGDGT